jgi:hypothetical protein
VTLSEWRDRRIQLRQRLRNRLAPVCQINHLRLAGFGTDQVLVALRTNGRQVAPVDGEAA